MPKHSGDTEPSFTAVSDHTYATDRYNERKFSSMINLEKEIREQETTVKATFEACLPAVKEIVQEARERDVSLVYFVARGTSDHACVYGQYLLQSLVGIPAALATPSVITKYNGKLCLKNALVIGVSQSGAAEDVMAVLTRAKECGAMTVGITNTLGSLVARTADRHIYLGMSEEKSIAATKTFTAQLAVMTALAAVWGRIPELIDGMNGISEKIRELFATVPSEIESFINDFAELDNAVVLGRGYNYPIALEGALKVMETSKINMRGYPMSDFYHGPFAQLTNGGTAFLIASDGVMLEDSRAMLAKLNKTPTRTVVLSDNADILKDCKYAIKVPSIGNEALSPYMFAIAMQLFALKLTEVKGIDPDRSDVIKKVTVTK